MNQEKIGKFIVECRKEKNLTQEQLAEKVGVSSKSVSRWENGKTMPDYTILQLHLKFLVATATIILGTTHKGHSRKGEKRNAQDGV